MHIFRDYRTLAILFGLPVAEILIFGFVISMDIKDAGIAFLDLSKDDVTMKISEKICSSGFFKKAGDLQSYDDIDRIMKAGNARAVIVYGENFGRDLLSRRQASMSIITDASEPNTATLITNYASAIVTDFNMGSGGTDPAGTLLVRPEVRMFYNPGLRSHFMFVPGVITFILILICALMTSIAITREKEFGTMEVLLVSPLKPAQIILGKVMPYFILSFVNVIFILLLSRLAFNLPVRGSLALLLAESMLYIFMSLSLGILISTVSKTMQQAIFISLVGLLLPTILLSGFIFPLENMPEVYDIVASFLPPRYFITIIKNIMIKGTGFASVWKETLVLILMTLVFIGLSVKKFKIRLQ